MKQSSKKLALVGSGLVGSLLGIYLLRRGHKVTVFDRRPDIRKMKFSGRSINLAMSHRGWNALNQVGLEEEIKKIAIHCIDVRCMCLMNRLTRRNTAKGRLWSIGRGILNKRMIDLAEKEGVDFRFDEKVWDVDLPEATVLTGATVKDDWVSHKFDIVFGCDGAFSGYVIKCKDAVGSIILRNLLIWDTKSLPFQRTKMATMFWIKIVFTFGREVSLC